MSATLVCLASACAVTWPLPRHLTTHFLGSPTGDLGVYVWNLWIFSHEVAVHGRWPLSTDHVFAYTFGTDFALHNYTALAGAAAAPLLATLGVVATFNLLLLIALATAGLGVCTLARRAGLPAGYAVISGALFIASPVITARSTAHFSLVIAVWLPLFVVVLQRLVSPLRPPRRRDAVLLGGCVAAAFYSDAYYGIYCSMLGVVIVGWQFLRIERRPAQPNAATRWLDLSMMAIVAVVTWRLAFGATELHFGPFRLQVGTLFNPMLAVVLLASARAWLTYRPAVHVEGLVDQLWPLVRAAALAIAVTTVLLTPVLTDLIYRWLDGQLPDTPIFWRSSPRGVDLLAYVVPNPSLPWLGGLAQTRVMPPIPDAFPEFVAAFPLSGWVLVALSRPWSGERRLFALIAGIFIALSLGPFIHVAGVNTAIIGPWALLRYLPLIGMARSPARFAIVASLALAVLAGFGLRAVFEDHRRRWLMVLVPLLAVELLPLQRPLFSAAVPPVYELVNATADERGRLLELPTGIRDGTSSLGDFNASTQYFQTFHRRRLVGGYLSRVSEARKQASARSPVLRALFRLSSGVEALPPDWVDAAHAARDRFFARTCVQFVLIDRRRSSAALQTFAVDVLRLVSRYRDESYELLEPIDPPACTPRPVGPRGWRLALNAR